MMKTLTTTRFLTLVLAKYFANTVNDVVHTKLMWATASCLPALLGCNQRGCCRVTGNMVKESREFITLYSNRVNERRRKDFAIVSVRLFSVSSIKFKESLNC